MAQSLVEMAKELVQAQIQSGRLAPEAIPEALQHTYDNLAQLKAIEASGDRLAAPSNGHATTETPTQSDWQKSITRHAVTCLECGATFKQLGSRHLRLHNLDSRSYRVKYGIPRTQPLSARATTALRKQIVQQSRPWEKAPTFLRSQQDAAVDTSRAEPEPAPKPKKTGRRSRRTETP